MEQNKMKNTVDQFISLYNSFDVNGMVLLLHEDVVFQNVTNGKIDTATKGKKEFQELAGQSTKLFKSRRQKVRSYSFDTDEVTVEIDYEGILAVDLPNGLKADDKLNLNGKSIYTFKDGLISKLVDYS